MKDLGCNDVLSSKQLLILSLVIVSCIITVKAGLSDTTACTFDTQFRCKSGKCIPRHWVCDGSVECSVKGADGKFIDDSDEAHCGDQVCKSGQYACKTEKGDRRFARKCIPNKFVCDKYKNFDCHFHDDEDDEQCFKKMCDPDEFKCVHVSSRGKCVAKTLVCDGKQDCADGSDEKNCKDEQKTLACESDHKACQDNSECISNAFWCDGSRDCRDGSDEKNCPKKQRPVCTSKQFQCHNGECINKGWRCDGNFECSDRSDELNCTTPKPRMQCTKKDDFYCHKSKEELVPECIPSSYKCDGTPDCLGGEDEANCGPKSACTNNEYRCLDGTCVHGNAECNGVPECPDRSDEDSCPSVIPNSVCVPGIEFDCGGSNTQYKRRCISESKVCDGHIDCYNKRDENPFKNSSCPDQSTDPCQNSNGGCQHICRKKLKYAVGFTHVCECNSGYKLKKDLVTCEDINECEIPGSCSQNCVNHRGYHTCSCINGYWLQESNKRVCRALGDKYLLHGTGTDIRERRLNIHQSLDPIIYNVRVVSLDYTVKQNPNLIFFSDFYTNNIYMMKRGSSRRTRELLAKTGLSDGIAFDWVNEVLYFTDTKYDTIEAVDIRTKKRAVIINDNLSEPRGITVNPLTGYMYWTDWGNHPKIERSGLDGSDRKVLFSDHQIKWVNGITYDYVKDRIYWADAKLKAIFSAEADGSDRRMIVSTASTRHLPSPLSHPFSVAVFEDYVYYTDWAQAAVTRCNKFTGKDCKHVISGYKVLSIALMHHMQQPQRKEKSCDGSLGKCSHVCTPRPQRLVNVGAKKYVCACPQGMSLSSDRLNCKISASPKPQEKTGFIPLDETEKPAGVTGKSAAATQLDKAKVGRLAGIVIGIITLVVFLAALIGALVYRNYTKTGVRSMNFDNPVYRKTTVADALLADHGNEYQPEERIIESAHLNAHEAWQEVDSPACNTAQPV